MKNLNKKNLATLLLILTLGACQVAGADGAGKNRDKTLLFDIPIKNLENLGSLRPGIDVSLNQEELAFLIDTGSTYHVKFLRRQEFDPSQFDRSEVLMAQYSGGHGIVTLKPFKLTIGQYEKDMRREGKAMVSPEYLDDIRGILSPQSLDSGVTAILDFPRRRFIAIKAGITEAKKWAEAHYPGYYFFSLKSPPRQDRLWVVSASLEGQEKADVLLDTGAFITHFRSSYTQSESSKGQQAQIGDVWGNQYDVPTLPNQKLNFADKNFTLSRIVLDGPLANLEKDIEGIIGMDVLEKAVLIVPWHGSGELLISFGK